MSMADQIVMVGLSFLFVGFGIANLSFWSLFREEQNELEDRNIGR
jgi:hypothetical protein